jgi:hypothetical protein
MLLLITASSLHANAKKTPTHFGTVQSFLGSYTGEIAIDLDGPNDEMLSITLFEEKVKEKGGWQKTKQSIKLNMASILLITIDSISYKIASIEYAENKRYEYCCLRLKEGSPKLGLYQWGTKDDPEKWILHYRNLSSYTMLSSPTLEGNKISMYALFVKCPAIKERLRLTKNGFITAEMNTAERLAAVRQLIQESAGCLQ